MAKNKTEPTKAGVSGFLAGIEDSEKRRDAKKIGAMMRRATGKRAKLWGSGIVGYGRYRYRYDSGRSGESMLTGYSPRKQAMTVYIMPGFDACDSLLRRLGKHKASKSCLYIRRLSDVDEDVLEELITRSVEVMRARYDTD